MNHANKKIGACLKDASTKCEIDLHNAKVKVRNACDTARLSAFIDCLKLHARHGYKRIIFDFHPTDQLIHFCEQEGIKSVIGCDRWAVKWD